MDKWLQTKLGLTRVFVFKDFTQAIDFVNKLAILAEEQNHHPDIFIHSYRQVKITLITNETGTITCKDYKLAEEIENLT